MCIYIHTTYSEDTHGIVVLHNRMVWRLTQYVDAGWSHWTCRRYHITSHHAFEPKTPPTCLLYLFLNATYTLNTLG